MTVIYDAFISSHGGFPQKSKEGYSFELPKNVELTFITPRFFYGYCNIIKDKEVIKALQTTDGVDSYTKNKHTIRGGEECPNFDISFEPNKESVFGVWRHKRSQLSQKPTFVYGNIPNKSSFLYNKRRLSTRNKQPTMINQEVPSLKVANVKEKIIDLSFLLDILVSQVDNIEKKPYTLKIIINCCVALPTTNDGYTPKELVDIHKFMASTISGSSINDYYNQLGYQPKSSVYFTAPSGNVLEKRIPAALKTHARFYVSQLAETSPPLKQNRISGFGPDGFTVDGFGRTIPKPSTSLGKAYNKIKRKRLSNNVNHTRNYLNSLRSSRSLRSTAKKSNRPKKNIMLSKKKLAQNAVMKWMKLTLNKRADKSGKNKTKTKNIKSLFNNKFNNK
jgi:hypothetical protein